MEALNVIIDIDNGEPNASVSGLQWKYLSYEQRKDYQKKQSCFIRKREAELPKNWRWGHYRSICVCIGYRVINVWIPKDIDLNATTIFHFYKNLLPLLEQDGIPSLDYKVISSLGPNRNRKANNRGITSRIIERIDDYRCHFLTVEQFCNIDFVAYFKAFKSGDFDSIFKHFMRNFSYITDLHSLAYRYGDKLIYQLETNPLEFAIEHLDKMSCMTQKHPNRSMYLTN